MSDLMTFTVDDSEIRRGLRLAPKQIPFAIAMALTKTAQACQAASTAMVPKTLTVRTDYLTNPRKPGGFKIISAKKVNLVAQVGTRAALMEQLTFGGTKEAGKAGIQAVPTDAGVGSTGDAAMRGPDDLGTLMRSSGKWPKQLRKTRGGYFIKRVRSFGDDAGPADKDVLFQKTGPTHPALRSYKGAPVGRAVFARYPIQAVYVFSRKTNIPARFPFVKIVQQAVARAWPKEAQEAVTHALWTAK